MISGLIIARGTQGSEITTNTLGGSAHVGAKITGLAAIKVESASKQEIEFGAASDFV